MDSPFPQGRAATLKQAFRVCNLGALTGAALDLYWVGLSAVRNEVAMAGVNRELDYLEAKESAAILFTGHRGCGKSTELRLFKPQHLKVTWERLKSQGWLV